MDLNTLVLHFNGDTDGTGDCIKCIPNQTSPFYVGQLVIQQVTGTVQTTVLYQNGTYSSGSFTNGVFKLTSITGEGGFNSFFAGFGIKHEDIDLINVLEEVDNIGQEVDNINEITYALAKGDIIIEGSKVFNGVTSANNLYFTGTTTDPQHVANKTYVDDVISERLIYVSSNINTNYNGKTLQD
jgi:hypothetical protein